MMGRKSGYIYRSLLIIALAVLTIAGLAGCGEEADTGTGTVTAVTGDTGGRLQIPEIYHDFGRVAINTPVEHTFEIKNSGTGPLYLQQPSVKLLEGC